MDKRLSIKKDTAGGLSSWKGATIMYRPNSCLTYHTITVVEALDNIAISRLVVKRLVTEYPDVFKDATD